MTVARAAVELKFFFFNYILIHLIFVIEFQACLRSAAMFAVSGDQMRQSKSNRAGLQLSVGRFHRWMADVRIAKFIHE